MAHVLIVEDSPTQAAHIQILLEEAGFSVDLAGHGVEALSQIQRALPDLVVTDLEMPEMNGLELVEAVRKDFPALPVILMTAHGSEEIAALALRQGAASYVPKRRLAEDLVPTALRILLAALEDGTHSQLMHHLDTSEMVFVLGNDRALIKAVVDHCQQLLRCLPLADETDRLRVGLALEEALMNAYYHGNLEIGSALGKVDRQEYERLADERLGQAPFRDRQIRVSAKISRAEAVFVIRDQGPGFAVSQLPTASGVPDADCGSGRGAILMRTIMDEVTYNEAGNEVTMIKRRAPQTVPAEGGQEAAE